MEWLIDKRDIYFDLMAQLAQLDYQELPDADCIVCFKVKKDDWAKMLESRNRLLDRHPGFIDSFDTQSYFVEASRSYAREKGAILIEFEQEFLGVENAAQRLEALLVENHVLK
jgi:hypothetical protein